MRSRFRAEGSTSFVSASARKVWALLTGFSNSGLDALCPRIRSKFCVWFGFEGCGALRFEVLRCWGLGLGVRVLGFRILVPVITG